ncbi:MAG: S8 family serine peptidase [Vicinamibacteraceae bacterium]
MYLRALADCIDEDIDVVNLSIGGPAAPDAQESALFEKLTRKGSVVVAAMGNEREQGSPTSYPAAIPGVLAWAGSPSTPITASAASTCGVYWPSATLAM